MLITKITSVLTNDFLSKIWFFSLSFIISLIITLPYIPSNEITQLLEYLFYLSPRFLLFFLLLPVLFFWRYLNKYNRVIFFIYIGIVVHFQDININIPTNSKGESSIKLLSLNMGEGSNGKYIKTLIKSENPDVFLFQETSIGKIKKAFTQPWLFQCDAGLCIASKYPFRKVGEFSRRMFKGWGNFAVYYELNVDGKTLPLMNVHLETPRYILSRFLSKFILRSDITRFRDNKSLEASLITTWADSQPHFVMSGDFNMTTNESLYKEYFSPYQNALDTVGLGFNYTKYTSWHGVRIDHVLASSNIIIERALVMPSLGGDHRAIVTIINLP